MPLLTIPQWCFSALRIISKSLSRVSFLFHLIQALSHLKAAASLLDDQSTHIPKELRKQLYNLISSSRDSIWEIYHDCTDAVCLFLMPGSNE